MDRETMESRVRIVDTQVLSHDWYLLQKTTFEYRRTDGSRQTQRRETYDRGNGATILLYNEFQGTVILTRQFRFPAFANGHHGLLIEACAGLLDDDSPEECIRKEAAEETGYRVGAVTKVFEAFMSPGSVTERLHFFIAPYETEQRISSGGGLISDGEDIEVLELQFGKALAMIADGEIVDAKTIMLLQYASIHHLLD